MKSIILAAALLAASPQPQPVLRVAYVPFEGAAQVLYAREEGFFAKEGLRVELEAVPSGGAIASAVASDVVDVGFGTITTLAVARSKGLPFVLVAAGPLAVGPNVPPSGGLVVAASAPLHNARDLDGKVVCVADLDTLTEFATRAWMDANGGESSGVSFIEVPYPAMHAAIVAGRCSAGYIAEPFYTPAKHDTRTLAWTLDAVSKEYLAGGWFTSADWSLAHAEALRRFAAAMRDAALWADRRPPAIVGILVKYLKDDPETVVSEVRDVFAEQLSPRIVQPGIDVTARYLHFPPFPASELIRQ